MAEALSAYTQWWLAWAVTEGWEQAFDPDSLYIAVNIKKAIIIPRPDASFWL